MKSGFKSLLFAAIGATISYGAFADNLSACPNIQSGHGTVCYRGALAVIQLPCAWSDSDYSVTTSPVTKNGVVSSFGTLVSDKNVGKFSIGANFGSQYGGCQDFDWIAVHN